MTNVFVGVMIFLAGFFAGFSIAALLHASKDDKDNK